MYVANARTVGADAQLYDTGSDMQKADADMRDAGFFPHDSTAHVHNAVANM